jgi:TPR repeat protein
MLVEKAAANGKNQENIGVYREALAWFEQALAAGVQQSLVNMANLYHYGHLCKQDSEKLTKASLEKAISLYQQAAGLGDPKALLALGNLYNSTDYHHHHNLNTTNDSTNDPNVWQRKAFDCWYQAARRAQPPANEPVDKMKYPLQQIDPQTASQALLRLGNMYFLGTAPNLSAGYPQQLRPDYECARELWELAADCDPKNIFAWLQLGNLHFDGMNKTVGSGRTRYERALNCYQRAVEEFINQNTNYQAMNWLQQRRQLAAMPLDEITGRLQLEQRAAVISNALLDRCYRLIGIKEGDANLVFPVMNRSASNAGKHQERGVTEIIQILKRSKLNDKSTSVNNEKPSANQISLSQSPFQSPTEPGDYVTDATDHNTQDIWLRKAESVYHDALLNRWRFVENRNDNDARDNSTSIAKEIDKRGCPIM